ncbi:general stress protein [Metaplanococcus flavidus]|uniref:General stress protein n=1 Tax=Metaplanococcus flavidus TaxID=569883 RepID=A0ABW3LAS2_9BACL
MNPKNREFEMVYSQEEMEQRIEQLKMHGYGENDIHVLARDKDVFNSYNSRSNVDRHEAESFSTKFKSFFSGEDTVHTQLRDLDLDEPVIDRYSEEIKKGAILLYTDGQAVNRNRDNGSSFGDDTRTVDSDDSKRNTAFTPFGKDIERDGQKFNDEKIRDSDVRANSDVERTDANEPSSRTIAEDSERIYTSEVRREDQHGHPKYGNKTRDSRLEGETIHPITDRQPEDESSLKEKSFDHEPHLETEAQEEDLNREEGVNRRQDEPSPGVDPNLGPAPFGRDSEEEKLLRDNDGGTGTSKDDPKNSLDGHDDVDNRHNPRDERPFHEDVEKKTSTPPTPRLF